MKTIWGEQLNPESILPEYPRPQFARSSYLNLNGPWEYAITPGEDMPEAYEGTILVPFSPESELSGVQRTLHPGESLWYRRHLTLPEGFVPKDGRLLLHVGAADQEATVFWNGTQAAHHMGGYTAFTADVTEALGVDNTLVIRVRDDTDASWHSRGKQKTKPGGIWYTPQSGLWQTLWLEAVPQKHLTGLRVVPHALQGEVELTLFADNAGEGATCQVSLYPAALGDPSVPSKAGPLLQRALPPNTPVRLSIPKPQLWSPEAPYLYPLALEWEGDVVHSYLGLRDTALQQDAQGVKRLYLNGKPYFHNGLLDQGYWPDGLYTAPSDQALIHDIQTAKALGFNMLRKHIKVEVSRWYYHCDRLGMLVWQDMVNGGGRYKFSTISFPLVTGIHRRDHNYRIFARKAPQGRAEFLAEMEETVRQLMNHPSLVLWVPFNEGWGQFDAAQVCQRLKTLDSSRPMDHASGWHDQKIGDIQSLHVYFRPYRFRRDKLHRAVILSEFGGYNLKVEGHCWSDRDYGYKRIASGNALWAAYEKLYREQILPAIPKGLCATVYTQLSDVETELNGLMTYDRRVIKLPEEPLRELNGQVQEASPEA